MNEAEKDALKIMRAPISSAIRHPNWGANEATQSQYPSDIAREAREDFAPQGWKAKTRDPFAPPEKRLREATLDEQELARRVRKVCGRMTCDADVAEWRKLDKARAA